MINLLIKGGEDNRMKTVFLASGQGSQYPGMGVELCKISEGANEVFLCASQTLGFDLLKICTEASNEELAKTNYAQPAIMAVSLAAAAAAKERGIYPKAVAGHSLGEYAALCIAGVLSLEDGFKLIAARAKAMQKAADNAPGGMAAVLGLCAERVEEICKEIPGYVTPVNYNSPVQTVIAGETEVLEKAIEVFSKEATRVVRLNVSSAFHSKLMEPAAEEFKEVASAFSFEKPKIPIYSNLSGEQFDQEANWPELLAKHLVSPVLFVKELKVIKSDGYDAYIEVGPGKTLTGLVRKTLDGILACNIENQASLEAAEKKIAVNG